MKQTIKGWVVQWQANDGRWYAEDTQRGRDIARAHVRQTNPIYVLPSRREARAEHDRCRWEWEEHCPNNRPKQRIRRATVTLTIED